MFNLSRGSLKTTGRYGADSSTNRRMRASEKSMLPAAQRFKRKMQTNPNPSRVSAGALASAISLTKSMKSGSTLVTKDGGIRKANKGVASVSGVQSAYVVPSSSIAASSVKKSSLSRKSAGAIVTANIKGGTKSKITGARKVKFSTNVHTFPPSNVIKKSASSSIGGLQLKKRVRKLRHKASGGDKSNSVSNKINLSISQQRSAILKRDVVQHGAIVDVTPTTTTTTTKPKVANIKSSTSGKKVKKLRIKAGGAVARQPVPAGYIRPSPRLAYSIPPEARRDQQLPIRKAKSKSVPVPFR